MSVLEKTSYELALAALGHQERSLVDLRARTATLLTAASLIASFLGSEAIGLTGMSHFVVLALTAFCFSIALCIYVLLPHGRLVFALDGHDAYESLFEVRDDEAEVWRRLGYFVRTLQRSNEAGLQSLSRLFQTAGAGLLLQIVFLAAAIALS